MTPRDFDILGFLTPACPCCGEPITDDGDTCDSDDCRDEAAADIRAEMQAEGDREARWEDGR